MIVWSLTILINLLWRWQAKFVPDCTKPCLQTHFPIRKFGRETSKSCRFPCWCWENEDDDDAHPRCVLMCVMAPVEGTFSVGAQAILMVHTLHHPWWFFRWSLLIKVLLTFQCISGLCCEGRDEEKEDGRKHLSPERQQCFIKYHQQGRFSKKISSISNWPFYKGWMTQVW